MSVNGKRFVEILSDPAYDIEMSGKVKYEDIHSKLAGWFRLKSNGIALECFKIWRQSDKYNENKMNKMKNQYAKCEKEGSPWVVCQTIPFNTRYVVVETISKAIDGYVCVVTKKNRDIIGKIIPSGPTSFVCHTYFKNKFKKKGAVKKLFNAIRTEILLLHAAARIPYIIDIIEVLEDKDQVYIIHPYHPHGTLEDYILSQPEELMDEDNVAKWFRDVVECFISYHEIGIREFGFNLRKFCLRGDPKARVGAKNPLVLTSLGIIQRVYVLFHKKKNTCHQDVFYRFPEYYDKKDKLKERNCSYSLGVVLYILKYGRPPFFAKQDKFADFEKEMKQIIKTGFKNEFYDEVGPWFPKYVEISDNLRDLIANLLVTDPANRLSIADIFSHDFMLETLPYEHALQSIGQACYKVALCEPHIRECIDGVLSATPFDPELYKILSSKLNELWNVDNMKGTVRLDDFIEGLLYYNSTITRDRLITIVEFYNARKTFYVQTEDIIAAQRIKEKEIADLPTRLEEKFESLKEKPEKNTKDFSYDFVSAKNFKTILINTPGFSKNLIKKLMKEYSVEDFRAPPKKDKKKEENNHPKPHPYICKYAQFCDDLKHGCGSDIDRNCRKLLVKDKERLAKILKKMQKQAAAAKKNKDKGKQKSKSPKKKNNQT